MKENSIGEDIKYTEDLIALANMLPIGELKIQEKEIEVLEHLIKHIKS